MNKYLIYIIIFFTFFSFSCTTKKSKESGLIGKKNNFMLHAVTPYGFENKNLVFQINHTK